MPATCFNRLLRSAGVIAAALACELAPLSQAWLRYGASQRFRSDLYALVGYKCDTRRTRTAAGVGVLHSCAALELAC